MLAVACMVSVGWTPALAEDLGGDAGASPAEVMMSTTSAGGEAPTPPQEPASSESHPPATSQNQGTGQNQGGSGDSTPPADSSPPPPPPAPATSSEAPPTDSTAQPSDDAALPDALQMGAADASDAALPAPPYVRLRVVDGHGVAIGGITLQVQGPRLLPALPESDEDWDHLELTTILDNQGEPGYLGVDADPRPGYFALKQLPADRDPMVIHDVANEELFRARMTATSHGPVTGDAGAWTLVESLDQVIPDHQVLSLVLGSDTDGVSEELDADETPEGAEETTDEGVGLLMLGTPEPTVDPPYVYWRVEQGNGEALAGTIFSIAPRSGGTWGTALSVPDCVAASSTDCTGRDLDPDAGEFQVKYLGTGSTTPVVADARYRVRQDVVPSGYSADPNRNTTTWIAIGANESWNDGNGPDTHDFGVWNNLPSGTSRIVVYVGADRTGTAGVTRLEGVVMHLFTNVTGPGNQNNPGVRADGKALDYTGADGWARCVSNSAGECGFVVPLTGGSSTNPQANRDKRFWVVQYSVPDGWFMSPALRTGDGTTGGTENPYRFLTGTQLRAGTTYESTNQFMYGTSQDSARASNGIWQQSRMNPTFPQSCGIDVALVLDLSGSVQSAQALPALKNAADTFVNSLVGTQSRMALFSFAQSSPAAGASANYPTLTSVATQAQADTFKSRYAAWSATGSTNWDRGLAVPAGNISGSNRYQVVVVVTDGNPTVSGTPASGPGNYTRFTEVEAGILSANLLKAQGARVIAIGVGSGVTGEVNGLNLRAISGTTKFASGNALTADYFQTPDYAAVGQQLRELALGNCAGTLTVTKMVVPDAAPPGSIAGAAPGVAGWTFTATNPGAGLSVPNPVQTTVNDNTGTVTFPLTFSGATQSASLTVTETEQDGYGVVPVSGKNAVCTNLRTNAPVAVTNSGALGFTLNASASDPINCIIYNRVPSQAAQVVVDKIWTVNGVEYRIPDDAGSLPNGLGSQLTLTGPGAQNPQGSPQNWGAVRANYVAGSSVTINEVPPSGTPGFIDPDKLPGCTLDSRELTSSRLGNGAPVTSPDTSIGDEGITVPSLGAGQNEFEITNTVTCVQTLELVKEIAFGDVPADTWVLTASSSQGGALPGPQGSYTGPESVVASVTAGAPYTLSESGGPATYVATTAGWGCKNSAGTEVVSVVEGSVEVAIGQSVVCTIRNTTAMLTIFKNVVGDEPPGSWQIIGEPALHPVVDGLGEAVWPGVASPGDGVPSGGTTVEVRPGHTYVLSEEITDGISDLAYFLTKVQRWDPEEGTHGEWVDVSADDLSAVPVTVNPGAHDYYRFVNEAAPAIQVPLTGGISGELLGYVGAGVVIFAALMALFTRRTFDWRPRTGRS